jgi:hypothetical protein
MNRFWKNPLHFLSQEVVQFSDIYGMPSFKHEHLPSIFRRYIESDPDSEFVKESLASNGESWGFVINTFRALEGPYLDQIQAELGSSRRVFAVGPLGYNGVRGRAEIEDRSEVLRWLDRWDEEGSVLYVCFGSQKLLKKEQMEALAFGLERSGTRFVWVVKVPSMEEQIEGYGSVPDGFEDRVSGRGFVVKSWAPQEAILGHRVVGGFLSHCGWNSVLEAVVAGVVILGWPLEADMFFNARLMVEDMGMAVRVCEGGDFVPNPDELGRVISEVMSGDTPQKRRAKLMKEEAVGAVRKDGSSSKELDEFVKALQQLGVKEGSGSH